MNDLSILTKLFVPSSHHFSWLSLASAGLAVCVLAGCSSTVLTPPPVEDRPTSAKPAPSKAAASPSTASATTAAPASSASKAASGVTGVPPKPLPGAENAGQPGYYTVKPGDTLIRIGLDQGQSWRDIARWSGVENANLIEVGQVLRVVPPSVPASGTSGGSPVATPSPISPPSRAEARPIEAKPSSPTSAPSTPSGNLAGDEDIAWMWPAAGQVLSGFDEGRNIKGLAIGGKAGDSVLAAADGRVVYAGAGLRGYGNLVIVKHNATFLTAYAHNQALLVKEDQAVRRGQKIAEMGSSDAERVQLHFEIRRLGKPIDPAKLLPAR